jgi:MSHA biogenesis protein MshJ
LLTVTGPYAELVRYVATLEAAMPYIRWGVMSLKVDQGLPELTLQLFLLGEVAS